MVLAGKVYTCFTVCVCVCVSLHRRGAIASSRSSTTRRGDGERRAAAAAAAALERGDEATARSNDLPTLALPPSPPSPPSPAAQALPRGDNTVRSRCVCVKVVTAEVSNADTLGVEDSVLISRGLIEGHKHCICGSSVQLIEVC